MRLTLAAAALVAASGVALAQGTTAPASNAAPPPGTSSPAPSGIQTPAATMNTTPSTTSSSPSAVQTTNTTQRTAAAPVPGPMAQAARRISRAGFTKVTGLKKDNQGIWRGQAQKDGNPVSVSLDYQGNVTGQ